MTLVQESKFEMRLLYSSGAHAGLCVLHTSKRPKI